MTEGLVQTGRLTSILGIPPFAESARYGSQFH